MNDPEKKEFLLPDKQTYSVIQELTKFVDFVAEHKIATSEDKQNAIVINEMIRNMDKQEPSKEWAIYFSIFDPEMIYFNKKNDGVFWRKWLLSFEGRKLTVEAETKHSAELGHYGDSFCFYYTVYFQQDIKEKCMYGDGDVNAFIRDVRSYEKYITGKLNEIELDIDVW